VVVIIWLKVLHNERRSILESEKNDDSSFGFFGVTRKSSRGRGRGRSRRDLFSLGDFIMGHWVGGILTPKDFEHFF